MDLILIQCKMSKKFKNIKKKETEEPYVVNNRDTEFIEETDLIKIKKPKKKEQVNNPKKQNNQYDNKSPTKEMSSFYDHKKIWKILICIAVFLIIINITYFSFVKDISPKLSIDSPQSNTENSYTHQIINNNTIIIHIDEELLNNLADKIINKINNETNSS